MELRRKEEAGDRYIPKLLHVDSNLVHSCTSLSLSSEFVSCFFCWLCRGFGFMLGQRGDCILLKANLEGGGFISYMLAHC